MATAHTPMTAAQFDLLPDEPGRRYELLDGEVIEYPDTRHIYVVSKSGAAHFWMGDTLVSAVLAGWRMPAEQVFE